MKTYSQLYELYRQRCEEGQENLKKIKNRIFHLGSLKLLIFIGALIAIIYYWEQGWQITMPITIIGVIVFVLLAKLQNKQFIRKEYEETYININKNELKGLDYQYEEFEDGAEYIDSSHLYTYDLDIFGKKSLFQYINRTCTQPGKACLANWLIHHSTCKEEIIRKQKAIQELTPEIELRQHFQVTGLQYKRKLNDDENEIKDWAESSPYFSNRRWMRLIPFSVLICNFVAITLAIIGLIPFSIPTFIFCAFMIGSTGYTQRISKMQTDFDRKLDILSTFSKLIQMIEAQHFTSAELKSIQKSVKDENGEASKAIKQLNQLLHQLDQRNNIIVLLILNGLFFWELWQLMKIEKWKNKYATKLAKWMKAIGQVDAYCSLSTFAFNHPNYRYPEISDQPFELKGSALGHPLMNREICVCNSIDIPKRPYFIIITGANMAGKSTYLRTIGINYLLACIGLPVWADSFTIYPAQLVTSLRTTDSLTENESYFFAELKRLKLIIDKLISGEELVIILDEILKGTNSIDKQKGSLALIQQFMSLQANGIIATHDLMLGTLIQTYPNNISNYCFEADIKNNELTFSYKMREGIAQNMNACFLMKKMGITIKE